MLYWTNDEIGVAVQSGSECGLNSCSDSSVGWSVWTEFSGHGFKSQSGQLSIATTKNLSYIYICKERELSMMRKVISYEQTLECFECLK